MSTHLGVPENLFFYYNNIVRFMRDLNQIRLAMLQAANVPVPTPAATNSCETSQDSHQWEHARSQTGTVIG